MPYRFRITLAFVVATALVGICVSQTPQLKPKPSGLALAEKDNGSILKVRVGETVTISLAANPSTGYSWTVIGNPSPLAFQGSGFAIDGQAHGLVGSGGTQVLTFVAKDRGVATITLAYRRPWENDPPSRTFSVTVNVHSPSLGFTNSPAATPPVRPSVPTRCRAAGRA